MKFTQISAMDDLYQIGQSDWGIYYGPTLRTKHDELLAAESVDEVLAIAREAAREWEATADYKKRFGHLNLKSDPDAYICKSIDRKSVV